MHTYTVFFRDANDRRHLYLTVAADEAQAEQQVRRQHHEDLSECDLHTEQFEMPQAGEAVCLWHNDYD